MIPLISVRRPSRVAWANLMAVLCCGWLSSLGLLALAQEPAQPVPVIAENPAAEVPALKVSAKKPPIAKSLTINNPVNDVTFTRVRNALVALQQQAEQEDRQAILLLELERGTSMFGQVRDLAKELTSAKYSRVRTVAWIPQPSEGKRLDGYITLIALACQEIVMHPDAELGDVSGKGQSIDPDEQQFVINMVEKRYNAKVNGALAAGFVDPNKAVLKARLEAKAGGQSVAETRVVNAEELRRLQESGVPILQVDTIKEPRDVGVLSGSRAKLLDVLVTHTATERSDLADIYGFERQYLREDIGSGSVPRARIIKIEGVIDPILHEFVEREIRRALAADVNVLIFEIDSPGGYLRDSEELADRISQLDGKKVRTIAYVPKEAISGAAIIAMGCDEIVLHPDAQIGDAGPIEMRPGQAFERADEKVLSKLRVTLRTLAERKVRPAALAEAMADKDLGVFQVQHRESGRVWYMTDAELQNSGDEWIKGPPVPESRKGNLMTLSGRRAHELKIAEESVKDFAELRSRLGIPKEQLVPRAMQTWVDTLVAILNSTAVRVLLFFLGFMCIYLEAQTNAGFFAVGAAACFLVFFWSSFLGGTAGWLEVVLFLFGVILIALEVFVIPGFGVFGIVGGLAVIFSLILASQTFIVPTTADEVRQLTWSTGTLSCSIVGVGVLALVLSRFMWIVQIDRSAEAREAGNAPQLDPSLQSPGHELLGRSGVTYSSLRPAGKAQLGDRLIDVVSEGDYVDPGTPIEVVAVEGNKVVVRPTSVG